MPDTIAKFLFTSGSTSLPKGVINTHGMLTANQQQSVQTWPFMEQEDRGAGGLAALEPHLRQQLHLQPRDAAGRHALYRRRQAAAGVDRPDRAKSARCGANHRFQRAGRIWRAVALSRKRRGAGAQFLLEAACDVLCRRSVAARHVGPAGSDLGPHHRYARADDFGLGHDRNVAACDDGALAVRTCRGDRQPVRRRRHQAGADRQQA